ncbi:MAG: SRPBCC family protein [Verrucomicrobiales bacterium]|nr:SRPBCC family protein [Verrucomicrobiales bacterium]
MPVHVLQRRQLVSATLAQAWDFFSDPRNLQRITPASLDFRILSDLPDRMYAGMMIRYRVRPLLGIPVTWVTEITHVEEGRRFVDEQRVGPYRMWHHEHEFRDAGGGRVEILDRVTYQLPFSWFSEPVHRVLVQPRLDDIFDFRTRAVENVFPEPAGVGEIRST